MRAVIRHFTAVIVIAGAVSWAGCTAGRPSAGAPPGSPALKDRPASTATLQIVAPGPGAVIRGPQLIVRFELTGGRILPLTTSVLKPDEGHIHLKLDGRLISMNYGLQQSLVAEKGRHVLEAEFVAGDHVAFNPPVIAITTFTVE